MTYNDKTIISFYFSISNGYTQDCDKVFSQKLSYLTSVDSHWDKEYSYKKKTVTFDERDFLKDLGIKDKSVKSIKIVRDKTNRAKYVYINNNKIKGTKFRALLHLRSTDVSISKKDNQIFITTKGYGHGVGMSQYGGIQNTAATNRQVINSAEVKLQTDTARQIADLRAQGEFEKAGKVLEISNKYLSELQNLEKWAKEKNVGVQEFNAKLREWENEYVLNVGKYLTDAELDAVKAAGFFSNGAETAAYRDAQQDRYAAGAKAMMSAGIVPSESQLEAMGWTPEQYWVYKMAQGY